MNRKGFHIGDTRSHSFCVGDDDIASFQGGEVHPVCATFTLAREIEYASRLFVLEMKEEQEEGIGTELTIRHKAPAFPGETVVIEACLETLTEEDVHCTYEARVGKRVIARGTTGQKVLLKSEIEKHFDRFKSD